MFWGELYEGGLACVMSAVDAAAARAFLALALARRLQGIGWSEAALALGLTNLRAPSFADDVIFRLEQTGTSDQVEAALAVVAAAVSRAADPVDYARRRRLLASLEQIPWGDWRAICSRTNVCPGKRGGRHRYAAAWLWEVETRGDAYRSPASRAGFDVSGYRRFLKEFTGSDLSCLLRAWGAQLLLADGALGSEEWLSEALTGLESLHSDPAV